MMHLMFYSICIQKKSARTSECNTCISVCYYTKGKHEIGSEEYWSYV